MLIFVRSKVYKKITASFIIYRAYFHNVDIVLNPVNVEFKNYVF